MQFKEIPVENSGLRQWYAYDSLSGIQAIIAPCEDNSGLIGRISDFHTGETMKQFYGSQPETLQNAITDYVNSLVAMGLIASL